MKKEIFSTLQTGISDRNTAKVLRQYSIGSGGEPVSGFSNQPSIGFRLLSFLLPLFILIFSCKPERLAVPSEPVKGISGNWQIIKATRNGTDLTSRFDFSGFRITFTDSTYSIDSLVPFIVAKNGKWSFDDPQYPFNMSFTATDSTTKTSSLLYPVTNGQRNITITFSPGCSLNSYQYTLQKAN